MTPAPFIAVVGPSGVGKDSVMAGLVAAWPGLTPVRRVITRPADAGGEDHEAESAAGFAARLASGEFLLHWQAHGLWYGIPGRVRRMQLAGVPQLANLSRSVLAEAAAGLPPFIVLSLTASPATLAKRLAARGRETEADIAARLARTVDPVPPGVQVVTIANDGALDETVAAALAALQPVKV